MEQTIETLVKQYLSSGITLEEIERTYGISKQTIKEEAVKRLRAQRTKK